MAVEFDKYLDPRDQETALTDNPLTWARYEHRDLTIIEGDFEGDTFFPDYSNFKKIVFEQSGEYQELKYKFVELEK